MPPRAPRSLAPSLAPVDAVEADEPTSATLSDEDIHQRMIEAIVDQRLLPGTKLVEDKLGQAFGVSRTRIRQVLIRLAQEQVVTILPNKGASVAQPSVQEAREVFEARCVVEAVLVKRFIERAKAADLKALADCIDAEEAARQAGDHAMALRHSGQFHLLLAAATGHATFEHFLRKLVSRTSLILMSYAPVERQRTTPQAAPVRWVQACRCDEHRSLLTALRGAVKSRGTGKAAGKTTPEHAVDLMTSHLHHIEASLCFNQPEPPQDNFWQNLADPAGRSRSSP